MERINRQRSPRGSVTVRKKGNSYEARVTLELLAYMEGVDKNPRLSRTAKTEKEARERLGKLIVDVYYECSLCKKGNLKLHQLLDPCSKKRPWPYIKSLVNSMQTYADVCFKQIKNIYIGRIFEFLAFFWLTDRLLDIIKLG